METHGKDFEPRRYPQPTLPAQMIKKRHEPVAADMTPAQYVPCPPIAKPSQALTSEQARERDLAVCLFTKPSSCTACLSCLFFSAQIHSV